jgi:hypothetical protein
MLRVRLPVLGILRRQGFVPDHQHVLSILLLRRLGEVKTSGDDRLTADDDNLSMMIIL